MSIPTTITSQQERIIVNYTCYPGYGCDYLMIPGMVIDVKSLTDFAAGEYSEFTDSVVSWPLDSNIVTVFGVSKDISSCNINGYWCVGGFSGQHYLNVYKTWPTTTVITLYDTTTPITTLNNN